MYNLFLKVKYIYGQTEIATLVHSKTIDDAAHWELYS